MIRAPARQIRIKAIAHHRNRIAFSFKHRKLRHHRLRLGQLIFSTIWHQYRACSDGAVKHLHQSLLRADSSGLPVSPAIFSGHLHTSSLVKIFVCLRRHLHLDGLSPDARRWYPGMLWKYLRSPCPLQISTRRGSSVTTATWTASRFSSSAYARNCLNILRIYNNCHTLLGLGNSKLRAVQTCIFLRYLIQINLKTRLPARRSLPIRRLHRSRCTS